MKQKTLTAIVLLMVTVTLLAGCNKEPSKPQAVLIDIGKIAAEKGINEQIKERTEAMRKQVAEDVGALSAKLNKEFEDEKAGFGEVPSEDDKKKIQTLQEQLRKQVIQISNEGNARFRKEASEIRGSSLDGVMSVAQQVALEHGASFVLKSRVVLWSDGSLDITDEVLGRMPGVEETQPADSEQN